jgi:hypothetical protein
VPWTQAELPELHPGELIIETAPCLERLIHRYRIWQLDMSVCFAPKVEPLEFLTDWHNYFTGLVSCSRVIRVNNRVLYTSCLQKLLINLYFQCAYYLPFLYGIILVFHAHLRNYLLIALQRRCTLSRV